MNAVRVWAPIPGKVEFQAGEQRFAMSAGANGWWTTETPPTAGIDYGFVLDGEGPFPDPRSLWQPNGARGLSRFVDHQTFRWSDAGWQAPPLSSAVIYELHIGTFTASGTFEAAIEKLDHLVKLGITHVELMPVNEFPGSHGWGYDGVDLFAPHHAYGEPDGLKRLVNACHERRLAVLLDVVYNHLGPSGNYLGKFAHYFTTRYCSAWGAGINFDGPDSDEVRRFFCDNALMWLRDYHFDGLRLDAIHAMVDTSATPFLEQLNHEVGQIEAEMGRHLVLIAESDLNDPRVLWSPERGGFGLNAQWNDDFHHALHAILTGERNGYYADFGTLAHFCQALRGAYVYVGNYSNHRRRRHGREAGDLDGHRFLAYLQNHDQTGNRANGERSSKLMSTGRMKVGAALVLTSPFVPMLFQGEEWGASTPFLYFTDYEEPELAKNVREGRCREFATFGWRHEEIPDPQAAETFANSKLDWSEMTRPVHLELLEWYHRLIHLRQDEPSLKDGRRERISAHCSEQDRWLVVERGAVSVACNLEGHAQFVPFGSGRQHVLLASEAGITLVKGGGHLPANAVVITKLAT